MPLDSATLAHVIKALEAQQFQIFCMWLLRDAGYDADIGPLRGPDAGLDIVGTHHGTSFVAHCTIHSGSAAKRRTKCWADLKKSARSSTQFREFVFCSVRRLGTLEQEAIFKNEVLAYLAGDAGDRRSG